ncbi:unnamed protein product [Auanema sp. JU1783]|nr:unnamed protein product [Auanema sp. JU1783]
MLLLAHHLLRTSNMIFYCFFLLIALAHAEDSEDCTKSETTSYCGGLFENKTHCFDEDEKYANYLKECLVTCNACDTYSCSNPQPDTTFNCTSLKDKCSDPVWERIMRDKCPQTCGRCGLLNGKLCEDTAGTDVCVGMKDLCNSVEYYDTLTQQCASTCNRCPNDPNAAKTFGTCADQAKNCEQNLAKCNDANYSELMTRTCAKTCNKCGLGCVDADHRCASWNQKGYCTSTKYSQADKKKSCARTCNMCSTRP